MIGQAIGEYTITEFLGQSDLETYWMGRSLFTDETMHVRMLKTVHISNEGLRMRYLASVRRDAQWKRLQEGKDFHVFSSTESLCILQTMAALETPMPAMGPVVDEKPRLDESGRPLDYAITSRRPTAVELEEYHRRVQLFAKIAFIVGIIFGVATVVVGVGLFFLLSAIGAIGLLQQRKWGRTMVLVSHIAMMTISLMGVIGVIESIEHDDWGLSNANYLLIGAFGLSWLAYSIWGMVEMYSPKAEFYFRSREK